MTKQSIITSILNELGKPFDHELYERIGDRVLALRAKYLRQSIGKYGLDELLKQTYLIDLIKKTDEFGCFYYITPCEILTPIRTTNSPSPFNYVGDKYGRSYTFIRIFEVQTIPKIPINVRNVYYILENGYIKIYNSNNPILKVIDIFEDINDLIDICNSGCVSDNIELPMPLDFVDLIIKDLVQEFAPINQFENNTQVDE